jgi:hypothetical protein
MLKKGMLPAYYGKADYGGAVHRVTVWADIVC